MGFLEKVKILTEKSILKTNYTYSFQEEPDKNSIFFEVMSEKDVYVLTFWGNKTGEITKINKETKKIFCEILENIDLESINEILDKQLDNCIN